MINFSEKGFIQYKGRLKDMDEKCEKDMILNEVEESGFGSSNLDVMKLAFDRLNDPVTRMRFSASCGFWRWVAQCCYTMTPPQFPWLMLFVSDYWESHRTFVNLSDGIVHKLHLPEAEGMHCCGSFEGWLVMQAQVKD